MNSVSMVTIAACEQVVVRSMPVTSITREKRAPANQHPGPVDQWLNEGLQIRSSTFQVSHTIFGYQVKFIPGQYS